MQVTVRSATAMRIARSTRCRTCAGTEAMCTYSLRDIFEERDEIDFLLIAAAERGARLLPDDREHRLVIHLRVVKAVQEMNRARPGSGETDAELAGEFRVRASHERGHFFVPRLHVIDLVARALESRQ